MDYWSDSVECEWWLDELYHLSMKLINIDVALEIVLLVGKVIGRVKKRVYDIALLSHVNDENFNEKSLFDVRRFSVEK